jgi:hypothetical protein
MVSKQGKLQLCRKQKKNPSNRTIEKKEIQIRQKFNEIEKLKRKTQEKKWLCTKEDAYYSMKLPESKTISVALEISFSLFDLSSIMCN